MGSNTKVFARIIGFTALGLLALAALFGDSLQAQAGLPASLPAAVPAPAVDPTGKINSQVLKDTANGQSTAFVIFMTEQANLTQAYSMRDQDARGWYVYNTLRDTAARSQVPIRAMLAAAGVPFQPYWAANMIVATGDRSLVEALAARADVRSIDSNDATRWIDDPTSSPADASALSSPDTVEPGVQNVNAPAVWALGYTGQGIVVASQDTGVRWTHNALKPQYRGWNGTTADHNYNWWDAIHDSVGNPCGNNSQQPCDDYFHGTHTTGTAVGYDGGANQIGVAPGAKWIGCRNMDQGTGTPARYTECFQFMIAPTDLNGQNPNPTLRPHVIINSWGCPTSEGCTTRGELETIVNNTQASGIFVEVSAGNSGPGCSSVTDPPAIYSAAFSTGAIDSSNNTLASFSSRGPSTYYNPNLLKPNISAPGVNVRSATNSADNAYGTASGTSMAGPHVVGVVALIWSARPSLLRDITATKELLQNTANPNVTVAAQTCGGIPSSQIPNNSFGWGRVDALAAYNASGGGTATPTVPVPTVTGTNTPTNTPTNTAVVPTNTRTNSPTPTIGTVPPNPTSTTTNTATRTPTTAPTNTAILDPTPPNPSNTPTQTFTSTPTTVPGSTSTPTNPPAPSATDTPVPQGTSSASPTGTLVVPTDTPETPSVTPTACTLQFSDVPPGSTFYQWIHCLVCLGIVNGYPNGTFKPSADVTRGQLSKIVANSAGFDDTPTGQQFQDVAPGSTFYVYIYRLVHRGYINGYPCGALPAGACVPPANLPYFLSNANATRGQISKIVSNAANFSEPPPPDNPVFQDVPPQGPGSTFYVYIYRLVHHGIINGYPCGQAPQEPCVPPRNLPYFRPNNVATRGQMSKIDAGAFFPDCNIPVR